MLANIIVSGLRRDAEGDRDYDLDGDVSLDDHSSLIPYPSSFVSYLSSFINWRTE